MYKCAPYSSKNAADVEYDRTNFGYRSSLSMPHNTIDFNADFNTTTCGAFYGNVGRNLNINNCFGRLIHNNHVYLKPPQVFRCLYYYKIKNAVSDNQNIMKDILLWGPVCSSFLVYIDYYDFDPLHDGVYVSKQRPDTLVGGHAVVISGWGEYEDPKTKKKIPFWWVKNSWGPSYGYKGYFRMLRGSNHCSLEQNAVSMMPNCFPQNDSELRKIMSIFERRWSFKKDIDRGYLTLLKQIIKEYSILPEPTFENTFTDELLTRFPLIDFYFFHMTYPTSFRIYPNTGYSSYDQFKFVGLDYSPPFTYRDFVNLS